MLLEKRKTTNNKKQIRKIKKNKKNKLKLRVITLDFNFTNKN